MTRREWLGVVAGLALLLQVVGRLSVGQLAGIGSLVIVVLASLLGFAVKTGLMEKANATARAGVTGGLIAWAVSTGGLLFVWLKYVMAHVDLVDNLLFFVPIGIAAVCISWLVFGAPEKPATAPSD